MATVQRRKLRRIGHRLMDPNIELEPMDTSHSEMDVPQSSALNMTVDSIPTDLHANDTEQEDGRNGDDESEDDTFVRLKNRTYQCKFCPEIFSIHQMIRKHTKEQHPTKWKSFKCRHCNRRFASESIRDRHAHFHSLNHPFKCTECDQMYLWKKNLDKHFQTFHDRNSQDFSMERFHCESCELKFAEKKHYAMHSRIYHGRMPKRLKMLSDKIQVCERCVQIFDTRDLLMKHILQTHQGDPPMKNCICKTCSKEVKTLTLLRIHILVVHFGIMPFVCQHCSAEFATRFSLSKHMEKDHSEVAFFKCPFCNKSFTTESGMIKHKNVHVQLEIEYNSQTGKTVYQCGKCEKKYESKDLLDKHLVRVHPSLTLMYKCPLCSKTVLYRKQHMRVDHNVEYDAKQHHYLVRYKCHCCSKLFQQKRILLDHQNALSKQCGRYQMRFKTKKSLQAYMAIPQGAKSLKCEDCGLFFHSRARLEDHWRRYHSPTSTEVLKIINCPYCPKLFTGPRNRTRHIAVNHGQSKLKVNCGHCPVLVTDTVQLRKHYKTVHPEEQLTFKCPACEKFYLNRTSFQKHYKKHWKEAEADEKAEVNRTSEPVEDEVNQRRQTTEQNADGELVSIVTKEEAIVMEEEAAPGIGPTTGIDGNSLNTNQPSEEGMMLDHIAVNHVPSEFKVSCGHCPVLVTDTVQLRKHYRRVHRNERIVFKCPKCEKFYLHLTSYKDHYQKHRKESEADRKGEVNSTSESVEDGVKESGQTNDQTADAELESIVVKEEAIVQSDPVEDGVIKNHIYAEGELVSIVIKEEVIVQSGNAAVSGISLATGIKESSLNTNEPSEQGVMIEIIQEPLDNGKAAPSTALTEWEKSTAAEGSRERKSAMIEGQKLDFVVANKEFQELKREPVAAEQPEPSVKHQVISIASDAVEKPFLFTTEELKQEEQIEIDETIDKFAAATPAHRGRNSIKCEDCGLDFNYRCKLEKHRKRFHSPTSTEVLKIINCPYCPKLFMSPCSRTHHIAVNHEQSELKVNCAHCSAKAMDTALLRKHYRTVHPEEQLTFKCPACERFYLSQTSFKNHYKNHRKEAGADGKTETNDTSEQVEDEVKENDQNADGELESIVIKEEVVFQIGNAAAPGVNEPERPAGPSRALEHQIGNDGLIPIGDRSEISALNTSIGSKSVDLHSTTDNIAAMEHEDDQNGDEESEDDNFFRLDNRTYQCKFCPEIFHLLRKIQNHTKVQHPSEWKSFRCRHRHCKRRFPSAPMRDRHAHFHSLNHPFKCTECDQMYRSKMGLEKHFQVYHVRNSYNFSMQRFHCGSCELAFVQKKYYDLHSNIYHKRKPQRLKNLSDKIQVCERCVKTFDSRGLLMEHIRQTHQDDPPLKNFICKTCSKDLKTVTLLKTHILVVHFGIMPFVCQHCNAEFTTRHWLLKHIEKYHSEFALFKCPSCDETFATEARMTKHQDENHVQLKIEYDPKKGKTIYPCRKCEKKLESKDLLDKHILEAHPSFMLMYKCPLCSQSVHYRKQHMRVHHDIEYDAKQHQYLIRYKCHGCSKLFQKKCNLLAHQNALSKQCGQSQMRFKTKKSWQTHLAIHRGNTSFKCEDCGLDFGYRTRLEEHRMRYHSPTSTQEVKVINCPYCPQLFINPGTRKRHIAAKHVQSEFIIICGHCPVQVTDTVLLRKHYKAVHPEERVTFKCSVCEKFYLHLTSFKDHCRKHCKVAGAGNKVDIHSTIKPVEDGVEDGSQTNDQNADGEFVSIVIKEKAIVRIGNASAPELSATTRVKDSLLNFNEFSEQRVKIEIKQEPLDNGEAATSTDLTEWEKSTAAEETDDKAEPIDTSDGVKENNQNADGELVSIVVKEEAIVQIGNSAAPGLSATAGIKDNPMNFNELSKQRVKIEIKQEPLDDH